MGSAITTITFPYFLTDKERCNLLDCFRMRIIEELRFFFLEEEDLALSQKMCEMMRNIEKQGVWIAKKKIKIYIRHSQKNSRQYICCVVSKGVYRIQLKIHDGAFFAKAVNGFWPLFLQKCSIVYVRLGFK